MARLVIKSTEIGERVIELNLGVNRFGRGPENHFQIEHPTVSSAHCLLVLTNDGVWVQDCDSANGTFVNSERVQEAKLSAGQTLQLGQIELLVETTDAIVAIPKFELERPAPPVVLSDGSLICPRHPKARATHQCTHCLEVLCDACVHRLGRKGGRLMLFCPLCGRECLPIGGEKRKKKSFFDLLHRTVKLPFLHGTKQD